MAKRAEKRHALYVDDLRQVAPNQADKEIDAVLSFLANTTGLDRCRRELREAEAASGDLVTFRVEDDFLHEVPTLLQAWREKNLPEQLDDLGVIRAQCLICGQPNSEIARLHEGIKIPSPCLASPVGAMYERRCTYFRSRETPPATRGPYCRSCSLVDICLPEATAHSNAARWVASQRLSLRQEV